MKYFRLAPFTRPFFAKKWLSWIPIVELEMFRDFSRVNHKFEIMFTDTKVLTLLWFKDKTFKFRKEWK